MRVTQDVYDYIFIKLTVLKNLIMKPDEMERMKSYTDLVSLIEFLKNFYPGLNPNDKSVIALEKNLWDIYFKIIEKIIYSAPIAIEQFIRSTMIRFEVWNIKVIILSMITQTPIDLKTMLIYRIAAQILGREDLLNDLLKASVIRRNSKGFY